MDSSSDDVAVHLQRRFSSPPNVVFDAWIEPRIVRHWLFASPKHEIQEVKIDACVGGSFSILEWTGTEHIGHFGKFLQVERPHRLTFTLEVPKYFPGVTRIDIDFKPHAGGCLMTFKQVGVKKETTEGPWRKMLDALAEVLSSGGLPGRHAGDSRRMHR